MSKPNIAWSLVCSLVALAGCSSSSDGSAGGGSGGGGAVSASGGSGAVSASGGSSGGAPSPGGASSAGGSNSGGTTSSGGMGGALRPPNPRTDIGPADGVDCPLDSGDTQCGLQEKCCELFPWAPNACQPAGAPCSCPACGTHSFNDIGCDGPEDCPGALCCAYSTGTQQYSRTACAPSCQGNGESVVCKDPRDCLSTGDGCNDVAVGRIKVCF